MKYVYILLTLCVVAFLAKYLLHQRPTTIDQHGKVSSTIIQVEKEVVNIGKIMSGKPISAVFAIKNIGRNPLVLYDAFTDCTCTVADYSKLPTKPGGNAVVKVLYKATRSGFFQKKIIVKLNSEYGYTPLFITGEVLK